MLCFIIFRQVKIVNKSLTHRLGHTCLRFYEKKFFQFNKKHTLISLRFYSLKSVPIFMETCCLCVFCSLNNKYACFAIYRNYFLFFKSTNFDDYFVFELFLLLCFCFKNLDLLDQQSTQFDFSLSTLFVILTSCGLKLLV